MFGSVYVCVCVCVCVCVLCFWVLAYDTHTYTHTPNKHTTHPNRQLHHPSRKIGSLRNWTFLCPLSALQRPRTINLQKRHAVWKCRTMRQRGKVKLRTVTCVPSHQSPVYAPMTNGHGSDCPPTKSTRKLKKQTRMPTVRRERTRSPCAAKYGIFLPASSGRKLNRNNPRVASKVICFGHAWWSWAAKYRPGSAQHKLATSFLDNTNILRQRIWMVRNSKTGPYGTV